MKTKSKTKRTNPVTHKVAIVDACAKARCYNRPARGSSFCKEHKALALPTVTVDARKGKDAKAAKKTDAIAVLVRAKQKGRDATEAIATLVGKGWSHKTIAAALSTSPGRVWFWSTGKACSRIVDVTSLIMSEPPRKDVVHAPRTKTLRAPPVSAYKPRVTDHRQLLLDLRSAINAALGGK